MNGRRALWGRSRVNHGEGPSVSREVTLDTPGGVYRRGSGSFARPPSETPGEYRSGWSSDHRTTRGLDAEVRGSVVRTRGRDGQWCLLGTRCRGTGCITFLPQPTHPSSGTIEALGNGVTEDPFHPSVTGDVCGESPVVGPSLCPSPHR